jgi:hypothetical protein
MCAVSPLGIRSARIGSGRDKHMRFERVSRVSAKARQGKHAARIDRLA